MELLLVFIALFFCYLWINNKRKNKLKIYSIEHYMKMDNPIPVCGAPDVVWIDRQETLIVGDYKSRYNGKVYESDIIQLSVYRLLLEKTQAKKVAPYGFIHFKNRLRVKVDLLSSDEVISLYRQYQDVTGGTVKAHCTKNKGYCKYCEYLGSC